MSQVSATQSGLEGGGLSLVDVDGKQEIRRVLAHPGHSTHIVQLYDTAAFLVENVGQFILEGLRADERAIVIASQPHRSSLEQFLDAHGIDIDRLSEAGEYQSFDAVEMLARISTGGRVGWHEFDTHIGAIVRAAVAGGNRRLRAYGEMVDVLWQDGRRESAIELEEHWNRLAGATNFALLCAYISDDFATVADREAFAAVCNAHTHVLPADRYARIDNAEGRLREITRLQQHARSLENELVYRQVLEQELRDALAREASAREDAERAVHYNELFAGMLGHDLRNPLNAISMAATYIARAGTDPHSTTAAHRIVSSAQRMARMIEQLLDFTRIRIGDGLALNLARVDLAELCYRIKDEMEAAYPACAVTVSLQGDPIGNWDYDRLMQVLSNLVGNAIHHGTEGCQILIDADGKLRKSVSIVVHNDGAVAPELLPVLFEPFRGSARFQGTQGLGLGLYITRQIVVAHGGSIDVESTPEAGTTFRVMLPRA